MKRDQFRTNCGLQGAANSLRNQQPVPLQLANANSRGSELPPKRVSVIPPRLLSSILILLGAIALFIAVVYTSSVLALIGLGLLFFGVTFTFVRSDEYVKKILLKTAVSSQQATLEHIFKELQYEGKTVYLPPKYFSDPKVCKAFISEQKSGQLPILQQTQENEQSFLMEKPAGVLFAPIGAELSSLFEATLGKDLSKVDLEYLRQNMPKLFVEDLEMAGEFEIEVKGEKIRVKMHDSVFATSDVDAEKSLREYSMLNSLLGSAIACILAKTTNKLILIENEQTSGNGKDVIIEYRVINDEEQTEK